MGFERESFDKLMKVVWGKKSQMQQAMSRDSKGEPFIIRELEFKGAPNAVAVGYRVEGHVGQDFHAVGCVGKKGSDRA